MRRLIVPMLLMLVVGFAARPAAAELPDAVKRYVDDATLLVGRIDATRFDSEAILAFLEEAAADQPEDQRQEMMAEARQGLDQATQQLKPLVDAGVKDAYFIVGMGAMQGQGPLFVVPATGAEQAAAVEAFAGGLGQSVKKLEDAILVGEPAVIQAAEMTQAADRPQFGVALGEPGDAMVQLALVPTPMVKMFAAQGLRNLAQQQPDMPAGLAGAVEKLELISLTFAAPPTPRMHSEVKFADAQTAQAMLEAGKASSKAMQEQAAASGQDAAATAKVIEAMTPKLVGSSLVMELNKEQILALIKAGMQEETEQAIPEAAGQ